MKKSLVMIAFYPGLQRLKLLERIIADVWPRNRFQSSLAGDGQFMDSEASHGLLKEDLRGDQEQKTWAFVKQNDLPTGNSGEHEAGLELLNGLICRLGKPNRI